MSLPDVPRTVVVTGCSSGIGLSTARLLRERGWTVLPTARKPADLDMLKGEGFDPVDIDVADGASTARAADEILARTGGGVGALGRPVGGGGGGLGGVIAEPDGGPDAACAPGCGPDGLGQVTAPWHL